MSTGLSDVVLAVPDADGSVWALATAAGALWRGSFEGERFVGERMAPGLGVVHAMAFGPDGGLLVLCQLGLVGIARDGAVLRHAEHELSRGALAVGPGLVALSAPGGRIELRSPDGARRLRELEGHAQEVVGLALSPDGTTLVSSDGLDVRVWDTRSGRKRGRLHPPAVPSGALAIDPTGRFAVIGAAGALLVDLERMRPFGRLQVGTGRAILLHPDGASLLVGTDRGAVSASSMAEITAAYERSRALDEEGMDVGVPVVHGCSVLLQGGHGTPVWGIAASGDGRWLATGSHGSVVKLWDARSLRLVRDLTSPGSVPAWAQAFSADSTTLAANVGEEIRLFDVPSGTERRRLEPHDGLVLALAFHPRGRTLVSSAAGRQARVWDTEAGTWRPLASGQRVVRALAFSPDEASLVGACSDGAILLWDAAALGPDAEPRLLGLHATGAWAVAYDPASGILASGAEDGEVRLWRTDTGDVLATLRAQPRIRHLSFSSDGTHLAAACYALPSTTWDLAAIRTRLADLGLAWEDAR